MFHSYYDSPIGKLLLIANQEALIELRFDPELGIKEESNHILAITSTQLEEFFSKQRTFFDIPLQPTGTDFQLQVWKQLQEIKFGQSITYLQLAKNLGNPLVIRAAASANGKNPIPIIIPCHRVLGAKGTLTGFSGGLWRKEWLLALEGNVLF